MDEEQKQVQKQIREGGIADPEKSVSLPCINTTGGKTVGRKKATPTGFCTCRIAADLLSKEERGGGMESEGGISLDHWDDDDDDIFIKHPGLPYGYAMRLQNKSPIAVTG